MLCSTSSGAEISDQPDLKDQVKFVIKPVKDVTNVTAQDKDDENVRLMFIPKIAKYLGLPV